MTRTRTGVQFGASESLIARTTQVLQRTTNSSPTPQPVGDGGEGSPPTEIQVIAPPSEPNKNWSDMTEQEQTQYLEGVETKLGELKNLLIVEPERGCYCKVMVFRSGWVQSIANSHRDKTWDEILAFIMVEWSESRTTTFPFYVAYKKIDSVGKNGDRTYVVSDYDSYSHWQVIDEKTGQPKEPDEEAFLKGLDDILSGCHSIGFTGADPYIEQLREAVSGS